ncbi:hypothetical protein CPB97_011143 [Podila verticillata]|nr:hypothetical protein CPB97_011143 [Podila verticillata]
MADTQNSLLSTSQEHYLKKYLLTVLINNELDRLQKHPYETLPNLGGPFDLLDEHADSTTPFLRYLFESLVVPFPFLTTSRGALWPKLQLFMDEWAKIEAGNGVEREEMIRRKRLKNKGEKSLVLMYSMAIKTVEQRAQEKQDLKLRLEQLRNNINDSLKPHLTVEKRLQNMDLNTSEEDKTHNGSQTQDQHDQPQASSPSPSPSRSRSVSPPPSSCIHGVRMNVVGVRVITEKRHIREHEHAEYIVSSSFADGQEYVVARRHGRFRKLHYTLRQEFPKLDFPYPPSKYVVKSGASAIRTAREKDRISLRGYLHALAKVAPEVVNSTCFTDFLTKDAINLTEDEAKDVQARVALDEHRMAQQAKFDKEVARKVDELDEQLKKVKLDLLQPGGVSRLFSAFKYIENVNDLPPLYQSVFEWGCMNFASTLYHVFTSSDDAAINFTQLKRTHWLMPYRTMWGILKVSNPMAMMKGMMDLFLAQPFGSRSLMQRIISGNMQEEVSDYKKEISRIEASIGDIALCEKIRNYVYAPKAVIASIFADDESYDITEMSLVMDVLRSDQITPVLTPIQIKRVWDAQQKLEQERQEKERLYKESRCGSTSTETSEWIDDFSENDSVDEDPQPVAVGVEKDHKGQYQPDYQSQCEESEYDEFNLIQQLQNLLVAHLRIRDKERLMGLVFQGVTGEIFKEVIAIFYQPLVKVYKSANVADSLFDVKYFVDELIKIVEQAEVNDTGKDSGRPSTATLYLNLVRKHLPSFYKFVHQVHRQDDGIFHDLLEWIESIITFMRTGFARGRIDYKTEEELRATVDLDAFVKAHVDASQWDQLQGEAEELRVYFSEVKDRKKEQVRQMAGLDRASRSAESSGASMESESERVANELRGIGLQQEDVDELELMNYDGFKGEEEDTVDGEQGLRVPKVPLVDTLRVPFVGLANEIMFRTARE